MPNIKPIMITSSQLAPRPLKAEASGVVMVTLLGIPIRSITFFPMESPMSQISFEKIRNVPNMAVRNSRIAGDSVSKPRPANIAFRD